jgi:hypothetical protein
MKTKKFDYAKWGEELVRWVKEFYHFTGYGSTKRKKDYDFWEMVSTKLDGLQWVDQSRNAQQWRRIYYEAKRRERGKAGEKAMYTRWEAVSKTSGTTSTNCRRISAMIAN